jgi:type II secretory pathway component PulM
VSRFTVAAIGALHPAGHQQDAAAAAIRQETRMRKIVIAGVAALGLLAVGFTAMGQPASTNQAAAQASGADIGVARHSLQAMIGTDRSTRPLLVADVQFSGLAARSVLV